MKHLASSLWSELLQSLCVPRVLHLPGEAGLGTKKPLPKDVVVLGKLGHCFAAVYTSTVFQLCCKGYKMCQNTGQLFDKGSRACTGVLSSSQGPRLLLSTAGGGGHSSANSPMEKSLLASFLGFLSSSTHSHHVTGAFNPQQFHWELQDAHNSLE